MKRVKISCAAAFMLFALCTGSVLGASWTDVGPTGTGDMTITLDAWNPNFVLDPNYRVHRFDWTVTNNAATAHSSVRFVIPFTWAIISGATPSIQAYSWENGANQWRMTDNGDGNDGLPDGLYMNIPPGPFTPPSAPVLRMLMSDTDIPLSRVYSGYETATALATDQVPAWDIGPIGASGSVSFTTYMKQERSAVCSGIYVDPYIVTTESCNWTDVGPTGTGDISIGLTGWNPNFVLDPNYRIHKFDWTVTNTTSTTYCLGRFVMPYTWGIITGATPSIQAYTWEDVNDQWRMTDNGDGNDGLPDGLYADAPAGPFSPAAPPYKRILMNDTDLPLTVSYSGYETASVLTTDEVPAWDIGPIGANSTVSFSTYIRQERSAICTGFYMDAYVVVSGFCPGGACTTTVPSGGDIQAAIDAASAGDVICLVNGGVYTPAARINVTKAVTIKAVDPYTSPLPLIDGGGTLDRIIYIDSDCVTLDGLEVAYGTGDLIRQSGSYSGTVVKNCVIHDSSGDEGVQLANCTDCLIESCLAYDIAQDGFNMAGGLNSSIINCEVDNSGSENGAIFVYEGVNITIACNYIHDCTAHNGIKLYENYGDIFVQNNLIVNNTWDPTSKHVAYSGNGILGYKPAATGYTLYVEHNTIADNYCLTIPAAGASGSGCPAGDFPASSYGNGIGLAVTSISGTDFDSTVVIEDNILAFNSGWGVITKCYYGYNGPTTCSIDYNDAYGNTSGTYSGTCTPGANNISLDPLFAVDYSLHTGSPCIGAASDSKDMGVLWDGTCGQFPPNIGPTCGLTSSPPSGLMAIFPAFRTRIFSMSASDTDGTIASWELDVDNDGSAEYSGLGDPPAAQIHIYAAAGNYTAKLTVWDDNGADTECTTPVMIYEPPNRLPLASLGANPTHGVWPLTVQFSMAASDSDGTIASWALDIDDDGTPEYSGSGNPPATQYHTYWTMGIYWAELTVWDDDGADASDRVEIQVELQAHYP
jgi:hypothetical protein